MTTSLLRADPFLADVDGHRLLRRIDELSMIGRGSSGGITREGFSAADRRARAYLMTEATAAGLDAYVDAGGNVILRRPGRRGRPCVLLGSHLDTVVDGGCLDGAYGVVAALEVLQVLAESGTERAGGLDVAAVAFANEEGALFPQPFWGSMVLAGRTAELPAEPLDHHGRPLRGPLELAGGDLDALATAAWTSAELACYLELHIEQGPVLERLRVPVGVVTAITGRRVLSVEVSGLPGHAGTTPMDGRRDPLAAAAALVLAVEELATTRGLCRVATVGQLDVHPNSPNTVAGSVTLTVDIRDSKDTRMDATEAALRVAADAISARTGTEVVLTATTRSAPVNTDLALRAAVRDGAGELGLRSVEMCSCAGHDAQIVAGVAPVTMIFVPSVGGRSHTPDEYTAPKDLLGGARVLLRATRRVAHGYPDTKEI